MPIPTPINRVLNTYPPHIINYPTPHSPSGGPKSLPSVMIFSDLKDSGGTNHKSLTSNCVVSPVAVTTTYSMQYAAVTRHSQIAVLDVKVD